MKENRNVNYKARLWVDEKGKLHGISFEKVIRESDANPQIVIENLKSAFEYD